MNDSPNFFDRMRSRCVTNGSRSRVTDNYDVIVRCDDRRMNRRNMVDQAYRGGVGRPPFEPGECERSVVDSRGREVTRNVIP